MASRTRLRWKMSDDDARTWGGRYPAAPQTQGAPAVIRDELHEIDVRRRGDPDVKALLLEIRRLRSVLVQAHELAGALPRQDGVNRDYTDQRLIELLGEEPAITEAHRPARPAVKQETEGDRAAKRREREIRG